MVTGIEQAHSTITTLDLNALKTSQGRKAYYSFINENPNLPFIKKIFGTCLPNPAPTSEEIATRRKKILLHIHQDKVPLNEQVQSKAVFQNIYESREPSIINIDLFSSGFDSRVEKAFEAYQHYIPVFNLLEKNRMFIAPRVFLKASSLVASPIRYKHAARVKAGGGLAAGLALGGGLALFSSTWFILTGGLFGVIAGYLGASLYVQR